VEVLHTRGTETLDGFRNKATSELQKALGVRPRWRLPNPAPSLVPISRLDGCLTTATSSASSVRSWKC